MNDRKTHHDVLGSKTVRGADDLIDSEEGHQVPLVVKTAYESVKKELRRLGRVTKEKQESPVVRRKKVKEDSGHPGSDGVECRWF